MIRTTEVFFETSFFFKVSKTSITCAANLSMVRSEVEYVLEFHAASIGTNGEPRPGVSRRHKTGEERRESLVRIAGSIENSFGVFGVAPHQELGNLSADFGSMDAVCQ